MDEPKTIRITGQQARELVEKGVKPLYQQFTSVLLSENVVQQKQRLTY